MQSFIHLSRYAGMREDLVQAGGGNSSAKLSPTEMVIKASGCQLADVGESSGWCRVNPAVITDYFSEEGAEVSAEAENRLVGECLAEGARPSIETFLHAITQKYTLHTHPVAVNILAATEGGWQELHTLFPGALFVGYATPGIRLAAAYFKAFKESGTAPAVIFLRNHGLVVSGGSARFVIEKTEEVLHIIESRLHLDMERYHAATAIYDAVRNVPVLRDKIVYLSQHRDVQKGIGAFGASLWDWQFCPDCLVYCGKRALVLPESFSGADFAGHLSRCGPPSVISHRGSVYILADSMKKAKDTEGVLAFSAQVALADKDGELNLLPESEQDFLLDWDAEKYRRNMK